MVRSKCFSSLLTLLTISFTCGCRQEPPHAAAASMWTDGAWALYSLDRKNTDGTVTAGTLRIASVGKEMLENQPFHWLEMREDSAEGVKITKFLAKEKSPFDPEAGFAFWDDVRQIIVQQDMNTPEQVPQQHLKRYAPTFVEDSGTRRYGNVQNVSPPQKTVLENKTFTINNSPLSCSGIKNSSHFTSSVNLGFLNLEDTTELTVEYYTHPDVPFGGLVEVSYTSNTTSINKVKPDSPPKPPQFFENKMMLTAYGTGAETQITGTPVEMEVMPFPFLEAARKKGS